MGDTFCVSSLDISIWLSWLLLRVRITVYVFQVLKIYIFRQCVQSKSNYLIKKTLTIQWIQSRGSSCVARKLVFYLTRVKVKVVRIARRVKVICVIKAILPAPVGLSQAGEGASSQAGPPPFRKCMATFMPEFTDFCIYINCKNDLSPTLTIS